MADIANWALYSILTLIGAVTVNLIASEIYDRVPLWTWKLVAAAAKGVPAKKRARYAEQWLADLNDVHGNFHKLAFGLNCFRAARVISKNRFGEDIVYSVTNLFYTVYFMTILESFRFITEYRIGMSFGQMIGDGGVLLLGGLAAWKLHKFSKRRKFIRIRARKRA
ncbi:hypothetical protein RQ479_21225 [Mesorhizobium sp. ISC25]|uniref:hypothetical protein n=1 Tax=Mesorhizobium sp. ISC25 TaxID=3077335 RepID=UPI0035E178E1